MASMHPILHNICYLYKKPISPDSFADNPGIRFTYSKDLRDDKCTLVNEPGDKNTWGDNYICVPKNSPYQFKWSYAGTQIIIISSNQQQLLLINSQALVMFGK